MRTAPIASSACLLPMSYYQVGQKLANPPLSMPPPVQLVAIPPPAPTPPAMAIPTAPIPYKDTEEAQHSTKKVSLEGQICIDAFR